ncbi:hypothetical protein [Pseudemcibacter aquimaris]|uniref:hypothetical protein n=1 Tax=Pseudemcibacter aquimaris TaxID=2857064 RepID=UPI0020123CB9|nr:hypothetical protein [Pseudemcibacter aquimaris]MCC3861864.1 hypothetical protein [Pseudemcibacter aquimaris]WDU58617.1 hypothetical protein KW060_15655 [Pseudemcibacter aquimaris]
MPVFVNNYEITDDQVHSEMKNHPAASLNEARGEAARALIIRKLLLDEAVEREIISKDELEELDNEKEENVIETLLEDVIQLPDADEIVCRRYYEMHQSRFKDHKTGDVLPFNMVREHIRVFIEDKSHQAAFTAYMDSLMDKAKIVGI